MVQGIEELINLKQYTYNTKNQNANPSHSQFFPALWELFTRLVVACIIRYPHRLIPLVLSGLVFQTQHNGKKDRRVKFRCGNFGQGITTGTTSTLSETDWDKEWKI